MSVRVRVRVCVCVSLDMPQVLHSLFAHVHLCVCLCFQLLNISTRAVRTRVAHFYVHVYIQLLTCVHSIY